MADAAASEPTPNVAASMPQSETEILAAGLGAAARPTKEAATPKIPFWKGKLPPIPRVTMPRLSVPRPSMSSVPRPALAVGVLALAVGAGYGAAKLTGPSSAQIEAAMQHLSAASADLRGGQEGALRLGTELKALKTSVDTLRGERDRTRGELLAKQERTEKVTSDSATRLGKLADQLERMEKTQRDPARINAVLERIERLEGKLQVAQTAPTSAAVATAAPTPPPKPVAQAVEPAQTGSLPEPKVAAAKPDTDTRRVQLDGYVLRDVDDGMALIEGRNGRFYEVAPGMNLPGIGKVEALERRGRHWVVLTPKGYIGER